eukprot:scaffold111828_cov32-Tisochrysis_lutea.AAC.1
MAQQKMTNVKAEAAKVKKMKAAKTFELGDYIAKKVGNVGSGKEVQNGDEVGLLPGGSVHDIRGARLGNSAHD